MTRLARSSDGGLFHVCSRGDNRERIFRDDEDHRTFSRLIDRSFQRHRFRLLAYALMGNHFHLLIAADADPMRPLQGMMRTYAWFFNRRYARIGRVFGGRCMRTPVRGEDHARRLLAYIHLNPVKHGIVRDPDEYVWTSHHVLSGRPWPGPRVSLSETRALFPAASGGTRAAYLDLLKRWRGVFDPQSPGIQEADDEPRHLEQGDGQEDTTSQGRRANSMPRVHGAAGDRQSLDSLCSALARKFLVAPASIRSRVQDHQVVHARDALCFSAIRVHGWTGSEVGRWLGISRVGAWKAAERELTRGASDLRE